MLVGLVGKPSSGKSTFFKALTLAEVEIANYPFTTIKANSGVGYVKVKCPDQDFKVQCQPNHGYCLRGNRFVPVEVMDVAGLIKDAHKGAGLGNQFLDELREADVLIHIVDGAGATNEKGEPVKPGEHDPARDIEFLESELDMWYLRLIEKGWEQFARKAVQEKEEVHKALGKHLEGLKVNEELVEQVIKKLNLGEDISAWNRGTLKRIATELRKQTKPMVIACNKIDAPGAPEMFDQLKKQFPEHLLVLCSAESELALREAAKQELIRYVPGEGDFEVLDESRLNEKQRKALDFIKDNVLQRYGKTGVQEVLDRAVFELLKYIAVFPVANNKLQDKDGNVLPDCLIVPADTSALELAYKIHTDIGKSFIKAMDLRARKVIGKEHNLKHRDVIEIVTSK